MNNSPNDNLIRAVHASGRRLVMALTGGGSAAIGWLLGVPGGSRTVLEAVVPYSAEALTDYLRARPEQFCAPATARTMAAVALQRCLRWSGIDCACAIPAREPHDKNRSGACLGIGCTASLVSDVAKRGAHRVHVAAQTDRWTETVSLELVKGARDRHSEEQLVAALLLDLVARSCGLAPLDALPLLPAERVEYRRTEAPDAWRALLLGDRPAVAVTSAAMAIDAAVPRAVLPGAFHPLHDGHRRMAQLAGARLGGPVHFELSIENVDKPPLDYTEIDDRRRQFEAEHLVWLTRAPTFVRKSEIFPGATFIVGADTLVRIGDPKYYNASVDACRQAITAIAARGCRFLVFGRLCDGVFRTLADLSLPAELRELCEQVDPAEFRADISSTQLRREQNK